MADNKFTIQQTFEKLKSDFLEWATNNLNKVVPIVRKVNGYELREDVNLTYEDVNAVPTTRKVNGHELKEDITLTGSDINLNLEDGNSIDLQVLISQIRQQLGGYTILVVSELPANPDDNTIYLIPK